MASDIRPEDIEAAIAAAEQRRRAKAGTPAQSVPATSGQAAPDQTQPISLAKPGEAETGAARRATSSEFVAEPEMRAGTGEARPFGQDDPMARMGYDDDWLDQTDEPADRARQDEDVFSQGAAGEAGPRRRMVLPGTIAVVALVSFGLIIWWAYRAGTGENEGGNVPVIAADQSPVKVKPEDEGGMKVPDQDKLVYGQMGAQSDQAPKVEKLLPEPETPMAPPTPPAAGDQASGTGQGADSQAAGGQAVQNQSTTEPTTGGQGSSDQTSGNQAGTSQSGTAQSTGTQPSGNQSTSAQATDTQAASTTQSTQGAAGTQVAGSDATGQSNTSATSVAQTAADAANLAATSTAGTTATTSTAVPTTNTASLAPADTTKPAARTTAGAWKVQLSSVKSEGAAKQEWSRMQKANQDLLGDLALNVQQVDLGVKGIYFRVQAGPFPNQTTAEDVCSMLKTRKQPCLVVKP